MTPCWLTYQTDVECFAAVQHFLQWCEEHSFDLNVQKTEEMLLDFREQLFVSQLSMEGVAVE